MRCATAASLHRAPLGGANFTLAHANLHTAKRGEVRGGGAACGTGACLRALPSTWGHAGTTVRHSPKPWG
jgi:hypothetical protein